MNHTRTAQRSAASIAGFALVLVAGACAALGFAAPLRAYLLGTVLCVNIALGGLAISIGFALTGGRWGAASHEPRALLIDALVPLALAMTPLLVGYRLLNPPWGTSPSGIDAYFSWPWLSLRTAVNFVVWIGFGALLNRRAVRSHLAAIAATGAIALVLSVTLFGIDWLESSRPDAVGSIIGFVLLASQLVAGLAFVIAFKAPVRDAPSEPAPIWLQDLASLLLAATLLLIYMLAMQLLIVWSANLPAEIEWYLARSGPVGRVALAGLVLCHGIVVVMLVSGRVRRSTRALGVAAWISLAGHACGTYWWLAPVLGDSWARLLDPFAIAAVAAGCWAYADHRARHRPSPRDASP